MGRIKLIRGEDYAMILKARDKTANNPMNLTDMTKVTIEFTRSNRSSLTITSEIRPAEKAKVKIQTTTIQALDSGNIGNAIAFTFDGIKTIKMVTDTWNSENPSAMVEVLGDSRIIPISGSYRLDGGFDSYYPITVDGPPVLGRLMVKLNDFDTKSLRLGLNQSITVKIDIGVHPAGTRILARFENKLDVID